MSDTGTIALDRPHQIAVVGLLQCRHRLHLEIGTGMGFRQSTLASLRRAGVTNSRSKWQALCDVNGAIAMAGGPRDTRALAIQRDLALAGKAHAIATPVEYPYREF